MPTSIFVSLPVKDVKKSKRFYEAIGFKSNPQFEDETAVCIVISETIYVMLETHDKFKSLTTKEIADTSKAYTSLHSLSCESRGDVDAMVSKAIEAGGSQAHEPEDHGFMYQYGFYDPDGHGWGIFWMDPKAVQPDGQA